MNNKMLKITIDDGEEVQHIETQAIAMIAMTEHEECYSGSSLIRGYMSPCDLVAITHLVRTKLLCDLDGYVAEATGKAARKKEDDDPKVSLKKLLEALLKET